MTNTTPAPPSAEPFPTLAALQAAHTAIALEERDGPAEAYRAPAVQEFVARAVATGAVLDTSDDRQAAQALINYWVSRAANDARKAGRPAAVVFGPEFETLLTEFEPDRLRAAVADADRRITAAGADPAVARRLLLRLVSMHPAGPGFDPASASRATLRDLPGVPPDLVDRLVDALAAAGVVRVTRGTTPDDDQVALRPSVIALDWPLLHDALNQRRVFRERAVEAVRRPPPAGWFDHWRKRIIDHLAAVGRWLGGLWWRLGGWFGVRPEPERLTAEEQNAAEEYGDLNEDEVRFLRASRSLQRRLMEVNRALVWLMVGGFVVAVVGWVGAAWQRQLAWEKAQAAKQASAAAQEQQSLAEARLKLSSLRLMIRAWSELVNAPTPGDLTVASARWEALVSQDTLRQSLKIDLPHALKVATEYQPRQNSPRFKPPSPTAPEFDQFLADVRTTRDNLVKFPPIRLALREARSVAFRVVRTCADNATTLLVRDSKSYADAGPFVREFWVQYWGEMLLVEREGVVQAMVQYGQALKELQGAGSNDHDLLTLREKLKNRRDELLAALAAEEPGPLPGELPPGKTD